MSTKKTEAAAHTPGPWHVNKRGVGYSSHEVRVRHTRRPTAIPIAWVAKLNDGDANAALIAAAPDLLAALKLVTERLAKVDGGDGECVAAGVSAIARAEGRES